MRYQNPYETQKGKRKRADSTINSTGQRNRREKNKRVQRKEETTMKRTIRVAKQENDKYSKKEIAEKRRPM